MRTDQELLTQILALPSAPAIVEQARHALEVERQRRTVFYNEISEYEKAEFINGEVVIHSPVKKEHNDATGKLFRLIDVYVDKHSLGYVGVEKIMVTLSRNDYEPDICFFGREKARHFAEGQSLFPAPDLVVEILSPKTMANDRGVKFDDYCAHGVQEYWIVDPLARSVEQYRLDAEGQYELILKAGSGPIRCQVIPGFEIRIEAVFDSSANLEELARLLAG
ncbi:MAG: Uma2 family endonuclease [Bacteroidetes bacterium]|nr:MAG: Uma2 family endonuclease [Bacteroidota bacterium]